MKAQQHRFANSEAAEKVYDLLIRLAVAYNKQHQQQLDHPKPKPQDEAVISCMTR